MDAGLAGMVFARVNVFVNKYAYSFASYAFASRCACVM